MKKFPAILLMTLFVHGLNAQTCNKPFSIVILGSSTAAGFGAAPEKSWVYLFEDSLKKINPAYVVYNLAVGGTTTYTAQPSNYVPPAGRPAPLNNHNVSKAIELRADAIIINFPTNDAVSNYSVAEQKENYKRISDEAARHNILVWVATPQPRNILTGYQVNNLKKMHDWIMDYYKEKAIEFYEGLASDKDSILAQFSYGDGIHLNNKGHRALYKRVMRETIPDTLCNKQNIPIAADKKSKVITVVMR